MTYVVLLLAVGVTIYALVDCWSSADDEVRGLPRLAWLPVVLFLPPVGGLAYLLTGRVTSGTRRSDVPRPVAPDDDPEFLHHLDQQRRQAAAEELRREQQARRDRKDREREERQHRDRKERRGDRQGDHDGGGHPGQPTP